MRTKNYFIKAILYSLTLLLFQFSAFAQNSIKGRVVDATTGNAVVGATISSIKTKVNSVTDALGNFSLIANIGDQIMISSVGFTNKYVVVSEAFLQIQLASSTEELDEVVVTALGIKREKKKLGYASQELKGESLTVARETNVVSQLAGKIAGVTVVGGNSGIGGSARVTIRGERSVDLNKNQPLYVIDGVPISNSIVGASGRGNMEVDFGNGAGFINPDDVESINVLKGPAASALYGSRAANGVIVIKTKSGKSSKGIGVEVNSNLTFENALKLPDFQNVYGQGNGNGGAFAFVNGGGAGLTDGTDEGWGPAFKGQLYPQYNSPRTLNDQPIPFLGGDLNAPAGSVITPTAWLPDVDGVANFFETGRTITNNVAIVGSNKDGDFRLSYTNLDQTGIVPNTDLKRNTVSFSGGYNLTDKFTARAFVSYIKSNSGNRPSISYGTESIMYLFTSWFPRSVKLSDMKRLWQPGLEGIKQFGWNYNYHDNPYLTVYENTNGQQVDRILGNITLKYDLASWLSLQLRAATDYASEVRAYKRGFSTQRFPFGQYREARVITEERNTDFLLSANKKINSDFTVSGSLGGNQTRQKSDFNEVNAGQLNIPGIYKLTNNRVPVDVAQTVTEKRVNSLYGAAQVSYKNYLFLELTGRNDWSSALTLPAELKALGSEKNSFFYSSAALSAVVSDMVKLPSIISFAKVRGSVAQVGNDTDPFTFTQAYNPSTAFGTAQIYGETDRLANLSLKPEISTAFEIGTEIKFLNNRVGLDLTFYQSNTKNQIINIPLSQTSGYSTRSINAGLIKNYGFEAMLNLVPVVGKKNGLRWTVDLNFSTNRSKVVELSDGLSNLVMASRSVSIEARVGERMGDMYGIGFARVQNTNPNGAYYDGTGKFVGQMVFSNGRPVRTTERIKLGNYNPDWLAGINNTFTYKNFKLGFLFDIRMGGEVYSHTQTVGREGGIIVETLEGRADGYDLTKPGNGVIGNGVMVVNGQFVPNDVKRTAREWHTAYTGGRAIAEGVMYDASFVKLRELQIGFNFPTQVLKNTPFKAATLSFVGRNLALWSNVPHVDPEVMSYTGGTALPGIEYMSIPSSRSYGVNLSLKF
ncbi:MAG: SusC/RagA family protein [Sphingobacteriia bacterium 24-36-13]|jgi:TonB-linked SusC/RagA family outer membrane protein|uniref:SusC/RagA family TonB-linked outer membrane protein n=1 Tax=Sediminibacterium sp. TaxID=1917865 RepID=UPI000BCDC223|nr:SusC/RagA family TonB-linked outer membrane protein [Sediminibacterium sp.]OYY09807.1 MAG: SusC/RagA family protein [Sphingobacteriia bacterium 35-36-14]OYZ53942.1 MAG: SusC/RagA family protein [Sphingobacteriia bacterium 24-36-13]OZA63588.1 MAG: SusC/RagA family protein [Sphingobacteriia bacterium 39-36-14]HQS24884.1 SusC/RagA family TonB-linked outer membrane protein [Sediminibacterium sp.]HQS35946.1 SusC/RagA family TonB-linked outer membrane protein [Sediminibacterium sp.]